MVEADRTDHVEVRQIIAAGRVIAVPGYDIQRRMLEGRRPQRSERFLDNFGRLVLVLEPGNGRFEVTRVGKTVGADRSQFRQPERNAVIFGDIATAVALNLDTKLHSPRNE